MTTATRDARLPLDQDTVERLSRSREEPSWLAASRVAAAERYACAAWPTGKEEEWRRFPLKDLPLGGDLLPEAGVRVQDDAELARSDRDRGVVFEHVLTAARDHPDLVRPYLEREGTVGSHRAFGELTRALFANGSTFVYVPANTAVSAPLVARKRWPANGRAMIYRTVVVAEAGSSVTVVEDVGSEDGPARAAFPLVEVHAGTGAQVTYVRVQQFGHGVWDLGSQVFVSAADSRLESYNVLAGSSRTKLGVLSEITGNGAEVKLYGLVAAGEEQRIDVNSLQLLDGTASQSDLLYLSALYGSAHATYYGVVRVLPTSHATGSYQECRNLLLSDKAGANPIPVLEILTNDVARCGHGATAGRVDEEEIFYVLSRGIDRTTAEQLLVRGSFARVIDNIADPGIRARVLEALRPRIGRVADVDLEIAA